MKKNHTLHMNNSPTKKKRNRLTLERKIEIAKSLLIKKLGYKRMMTTFDITHHQAREISKNMNYLASINSADENVSDKKNLCDKVRQKNDKFDEFMIRKCSMLREKKCKLTFSFSNTIAQEYVTKHDPRFKITDYKLRNFMKRNNLTYGMTYGEKAQADTSQIELFVDKFEIIS